MISWRQTAAAIITACVALMPSAFAQQQQQSSNTANEPKRPSAWTLQGPLGFDTPSIVDTLLYNYQRQAIPSLASDAYATTGNYGNPGINAIFFERPYWSSFFFKNALEPYLPQPQKFYNVYIPTTLLSYNFGGNKKSNQDRLRATFAGNVNRRIGVGAMVDYLYSKGSYENQASKDFSFGFSGYYKGDRYEAKAFMNHYNLLNKENGGITDPLYITDPAVLQGGVSSIDPKNIPTHLSGAHSRVNGMRFDMNHVYKVGYWEEEAVNDTTTRDIYIPVIKFIYDFNYNATTHVFNNSNASQGQSFWENRYINPDGTHDITRFRSISNVLGVSMIEGFKKWAKFALSAYADYEISWFTQTPLTGTDENGAPIAGLTPLPAGFAIDGKKTLHKLYVGGALEKTQGAIITYRAAARFGLTDEAAGDVDISGKIGTRFPLLGDTVDIHAEGYFKNEAAPYLLNHYVSNHFVWNNDFGKTRRFKIGGQLDFPFTGTTFSAGVENLQNYIYFGSDMLPVQHGGNVQVFSMRLDQKLKFGIWNWINTIIYQKSSDSSVIPLPELAIYSNMFLNFHAFRVLEVQFGLDCNYYTRYFAPAYQPATMTFYTQDKVKVGNYPFCNLYATCRLYKVRFFLMYSHINQGLFGKNYFAVPDYPLNPRRLQLGLSVDFAN